jgi:hypothetical protein
MGLNVGVLNKLEASVLPHGASRGASGGYLALIARLLGPTFCVVAA